MFIICIEVTWKNKESQNEYIDKNLKTKENLKSSIPFIGFLIGLQYNDERLRDRNEIQNHIHLSIKALIKSMCVTPNKKGLPYIILLDDMHWIDKMSLDAFEYLINTLNTENTRNNDEFSQLLILATYRNEFSIPDILKNELDKLDDNLFYLSGIPHHKVANKEIIEKVVELVESKAKEKVN